ncbi:hypothetical protein Rhopal_006554-T1 [Rhodotorula paludigena]|uniref:tRNA-splicing endonuclease subunit Sen15 domain-containing protein n=1 Tax=Rhodotorula paludigena TaxID=86838 RepID=A0AAV5GVJ7_9BASI|nr:hypothetical protein Rhopal_006554-T1 [Rhodotorula paludigena]
MGLTTPTSLEALSAVLAAVSRRFPSSSSPSPAVADPSAPAPSPAPAQAATPVQDANAPMIYLAVVEKDASIVYYVLRDGIVSPKEVPE